MNATGAHLQVLAASLMAAQRAGDADRVRAIGEELFDVGRELTLADYRRLRSQRAMLVHDLRTPAGMLVWRMRQAFRRPVAS